MVINCPACNSQVEQRSAPIKGDPNTGEAWVCMKCPAVICICCYVQHAQNLHPELQAVKKPPTEGHKKNKKHKKR